MAKRSSPGFPSTKYLSSSLTCSLLGRARPRLHFLRPSCTHTTESGRNSAQRRAVAVKDVSNLAASTRTTEVSATACVKAVPKIALGISISAAIMSQSRSRSAPTRGAPRPVDSKITCASSWAIVKRRRTTDWPAAQRIRKARSHGAVHPLPVCHRRLLPPRPSVVSKAHSGQWAGTEFPEEPAHDRRNSLVNAVDSCQPQKAPRRSASPFDRTHRITLRVIRATQSTSSMATRVCASSTSRPSCRSVTSAVRRAARPRTLPMRRS